MARCRTRWTGLGSDKAGGVAVVGAGGEGVPLCTIICNVGTVPLTLGLRVFRILWEQGSTGAGQGGLAGPLLTGAKLQTPHVTHHSGGIKGLPPLALGKVLLDLSTDRLMDVLIKGSVTSNPGVL